MKSFVIIAGSLLLASTCCAMNTPPKDNNLLLRRSAPPSSSQPGLRAAEIDSIDISKMSVNSRARHMTEFVEGELLEGKCSYAETLESLEGQFKAKNSKGIHNTELFFNTPPKPRPLGLRDRTVSAGPSLQSIVLQTPITLIPLASDDSDEEVSKRNTTTGHSEIPYTGESLLFEMDN